jgi:hypothetical protein
MSCGGAPLPTPRLEALYHLWPLDVCAAGLVGAYFSAPCLLQSGQLHVGVLVIRGHATRADFHRVVMTLIYDADKPLFLQG